MFIIEYINVIRYNVDTHIKGGRFYGLSRNSNASKKSDWIT